MNGRHQERTKTKNTNDKGIVKIPDFWVQREICFSFLQKLTNQILTYALTVAVHFTGCARTKKIENQTTLKLVSSEVTWSSFAESLSLCSCSSLFFAVNSLFCVVSFWREEQQTEGQPQVFTNAMGRNKKMTEIRLKLPPYGNSLWKNVQIWTLALNLATTGIRVVAVQQKVAEKFSNSLEKQKGPLTK